MKLRGIEFGSVFCAAGTLNFFGEGWPYHKYYSQAFHAFGHGFGFEGITFQTKTTTLDGRPGNMELDENLQPKKFLPDCIYVDPLNGLALNSVSLSGPGAKLLFDSGRWQRRKEPFVITYMPVCGTKEERLEETEKFADLFLSHLPDFEAPVALGSNISCPNAKHDLKQMVAEASGLLRPFRKLGISVIVKLNALTDIRAAKEISESGLCDALEISNTILFGLMPDEIDWFKYFGKFGKDPDNPGIPLSPLKKYGGGGLSGKPLLQIVIRWIENARRAGIDIPIIGGGGIICKKDVRAMIDAGADAISIGTVSMLRPWRVQRIIDYGNKMIGG